MSSLPRFLLLDWERWLSGCSLGIRLWWLGLEEVGWQEVSPLSPSPHTHHVCGKLGCSSAPSVGYFNRSMRHFRCVLLLFMALVNKVTSVKSPMHTRPSSREEEEKMGLNILVAVVYWVGSAILLKNTNRLHWDVITAGGLHTRYYTLWYGFKTAIILAFGHSDSLSVFNPLPLLNYRLFLQPFAKGLGEDTIGKCVLIQLCNSTLMWSFSWVQNTLYSAVKPFFFASSYPKKYLHEMSVTL